MLGLIQSLRSQTRDKNVNAPSLQNSKAPHFTQPEELISEILAHNNQFAFEQLQWLEDALTHHLAKSEGLFYQRPENKKGLTRPIDSTNASLPPWAPRMSDWFSGKTILVTGSSGFIGNYTLKALNQRGVAKIIGVDCVAPQKHLHKAHANFHAYELDILDEKRLQSVFELHRPDGVIHLAAKAGVPQAERSAQDAQEYFDVNVKGTDILAKLCHEYQVSFIANAGSSSEFGSQAWDEGQLRPQGEGSPLVPEGNYGRTKVFSEMLLSARALAGESAEHTLVTTFFNPIGSGERGLLVPLMTRSLLNCAAQNKGSFTVYDQLRGYTPVEQTLEHVLRGVERLIDAGPNQAKLDYQHCGGGITTANATIADIVVNTLDALNQEKHLFKINHFSDFIVFDHQGARPGDVKATYSDKTKAETMLLLEPDTTALENSVIHTVKEVANKWLRGTDQANNEKTPHTKPTAKPHLKLLWA